VIQQTVVLPEEPEAFFFCHTKEMEEKWLSDQWVV
jgi:hypothetical protein